MGCGRVRPRPHSSPSTSVAALQRRLNLGYCGRAPRERPSPTQAAEPGAGYTHANPEHDRQTLQHSIYSAFVKGPTSLRISSTQHLARARMDREVLRGLAQGVLRREADLGHVVLGMHPLYQCCQGSDPTASPPNSFSAIAQGGSRDRNASLGRSLRGARSTEIGIRASEVRRTFIM